MRITTSVSLSTLPVRLVELPTTPEERDYRASLGKVAAVLRSFCREEMLHLTDIRWATVGRDAKAAHLQRALNQLTAYDPSVEDDKATELKKLIATLALVAEHERHACRRGLSLFLEHVPHSWDAWSKLLDGMRASKCPHALDYYHRSLTDRSCRHATVHGKRVFTYEELEALWQKGDLAREGRKGLRAK